MCKNEGSNQSLHVGGDESELDEMASGEVGPTGRNHRLMNKSMGEPN